LSEANLAVAGIDCEFIPGSRVCGRLQGTVVRDSGYAANNRVTPVAKTRLSRFTAFSDDLTGLDTRNCGWLINGVGRN
jgi:hypothetical protein